MSPRILYYCVIMLAMATPRLCDAAVQVVGQLVVKAGNGGAPCFTISEADERRAGAPNFHAITVTDLSQGARTAMWSMAMPAQRTFPVSFRMCVPYAGRLAVLPQTPAAPLQPGRVYEVTIDARAPIARGAPRSYRAHFCIGQAGGQIGAARIAGAEGRQRYSCEG